METNETKYVYFYKPSYINTNQQKLLIANHTKIWRITYINVTNYINLKSFHIINDRILIRVIII